MDPFSRKLFKNPDARQRLSQMGGIVASSPELASTVQRFQDGSLVSAEPEYVVIIPGLTDRRGMRVRASTLERLGQANPELLQRSQVLDAEIARQQGINVRALRPGDAILTRRLVQEADVVPEAARPAPMTAGQSLMEMVPSFDPAPAEVVGGFGESVRDPAAPKSRGPGPRYIAGDAESLPTGVDAAGRTANMGVLRKATGVDAAGRPIVGVGGELLTAGSSAEAIASAEEAAELRDELGITESLRTPEDQREAAAQAAEAEAAEAEAAEAEAAEAEAPERTVDPMAEAADTTANELRQVFGVPSPDRAPKNRRERVEQELDLIKEVFGHRNKDEARERAMNLAMIGLAIAAGQSPNALTNIAQGALAGTQAMQRSQAAEREREDALRMQAFENVMGEEREDRQFGRQVQLAEIKAGLRGQDPENPFNLSTTSGPLSRFNIERTELRQRLVDAAQDPRSIGWDPDRPIEEFTAESERMSLNNIYNQWLGVDPRTSPDVAAELQQLIRLGVREYPGSVPYLVDEAVRAYRERNTPESEIAKKLIEQGHVPELYGVSR